VHAGIIRPPAFKISESTRFESPYLSGRQIPESDRELRGYLIFGKVSGGETPETWRKDPAISEGRAPGSISYRNGGNRLVMAYSEKVLDHYNNLRNIGSLVG
jgi:hypothetical protein